MEYVDKVLRHPEYIRIQKKITSLEKDRIYCHHEIGHALDVARMAWIYCLEDWCKKGQSPENMEEQKELVYVCALLHDIGRASQYEEGIHHSKAGAAIAGQILKDISFPPEKSRIVLGIISGHHTGKKAYEGEHAALKEYICRADHDSRLCFWCGAGDTCKWKEEERNRTLRC